MRSRITTSVLLTAVLVTGHFTSSAQWGLSGNANATNTSILGATTANVDLRLFAGNLERMRLMGATGNVGIGTSAPVAKLHVVGTSRLQGAATIIGTTTITGNASVSGLTTTGTLKMTGGTPGAGKILRSDATGLASWVTAASVETGPQVGSIATSMIPRWNGSSLVSGSLFDNGTNVGIGTTSPATKLSLIGSSLSSLTAPGAFQIGPSNSENMVMDHQQLQARFNGGINTLFLQSWGGDLSLCNGGGSTYLSGPAEFFGLANFYQKAIFYNKVGIGSASPAYNLDIQGANSAASFYNCFSKVNYVGPSDLRAFSGHSIPAAGWGIGMEGIGGYRGVYGLCQNGSGGGVGVLARSTGTGGSQFGVYGDATGGTANWGVYSSGNTYSTGAYVGSDAKLKKDVQPIEDALQTISKLKPRTYNFKTSEYAYMGLPDEKQYGFIAQELEEILPELVKDIEQPINYDERANGMLQFKGVNYTELIPLLTQGMQEQQKQIEELKTTIQTLENALSQCCTNYSAAKSEFGNSLNQAEKPVLEQNAPNPFNQETTIRYYLPSNSTAVLKVMDLQGQEITTRQLTTKGFAEVRISGNSLAAGTYTYTLIVDGKAMDSKLMVLTK